MLNVPENEMFSAYLDGELTAEEQADMDRLLETSPEARQLVDELKALSSKLQALPVLRLEEDLAERVLHRAEERMLTEPAGPPKDHSNLNPPAGQPILRRLLAPRNLVWPGLAVAVALMLMFMEPSHGPDPDDRTVRETDSTDQGEGALAEAPKIGPRVPPPVPLSEKMVKPPRKETPTTPLTYQCRVADQEGLKAFEAILAEQGVQFDRKTPKGQDKVSVEAVITPAQLTAILAEMKSQGMEYLGPKVPQSDSARPTVRVRFSFEIPDSEAKESPQDSAPDEAPSSGSGEP